MIEPLHIELCPLHTHTIRICVDSSQTVLEHHRSIISSMLVSQLEEKKKQGSRWGSNPGPPALVAGALTTELRLPTACMVHT